MHPIILAWRPPGHKWLQAERVDYNAVSAALSPAIHGKDPMKRDFSLIRDILLYVEEHDTLPSANDVEQSHKEFIYHLELIQEDGWLKQVVVHTALDAKSTKVIHSTDRISMSNAAHDFLDSARDETIFKKVMKKVAASVGTVSIGVFMQLLIQAAKEKLRLP